MEAAAGLWSNSNYKGASLHPFNEVRNHGHEWRDSNAACQEDQRPFQICITQDKVSPDLDLDWETCRSLHFDMELTPLLWLHSHEQGL